MQVNRASAANMRSASLRADAAAARTVVAGIAPVSATQNDLSDEPPPPPYPELRSEEEDEPAGLIDAIDADRLYQAARSLFHAEGGIGLLLNRNA